MCDEVFSAYNYGNWSYETEIFVTPYCVPNLFKLIIFIIYLLIWIAMTLWIAKIFLKKIFDKWILKKILNFIALIISFFQVGTYVCFLFGWEGFPRYLVYFVGPFLIRIGYSLLITAWFKAFMSGKFLNSKMNIFSGYKLVFNFSLRVLDFITVGNTIACMIVGPMVSIGMNDTNVNWFYSFFIAFTSFVGMIICILIIVVGGKLLSLFASDDEEQIQPDQKLEDIKYKLTKIISLAKQCLPQQILFSFLPIWMIGDLQGIFYFHFIFYEPSVILSAFLLAWITTEGAGRWSVKTKSDSGKQVITDENSKNFSYDVKELNSISKHSEIQSEIQNETNSPSSVVEPEVEVEKSPETV